MSSSFNLIAKTVAVNKYSLKTLVIPQVASQSHLEKLTEVTELWKV